MFKLTDSGCSQHQPRHIALTGAAAALVGHLLLNLPMTDGNYTYICEHGHTHWLTLQSCEGNITSTPRAVSAEGCSLNTLLDQPQAKHNVRIEVYSEAGKLLHRR